MSMGKNISILLLLLIVLRPLLGQAVGVGLLAFAVFIVLIRRDKGYFPNYILLVFPILYGVLIGIQNYPVYGVFKDVFYLSQPIIYIVLGYFIAQNIACRKFVSYITVIGVILAIYYLVEFFLLSGFAGLLDVRSVRNEYNLMPNFVIITSASFVFYDIIILKKFSAKYIVLFSINLLTIYAAGSRTYLMCFVISIFIICYPLILQNIKNLIRFFVISTLICVVLFTVFKGSEMFDIIIHSKDEVSIRKYNTDADINNNYRGYEAYRALDMYSKWDVVNQLFGKGCGTLVDVIDADLVGTRHIPILHNGYPYLLVKVGLIGLISYCVFGGFLFFIITRRSFNDRTLNRLKFVSIGGLIYIYIIHASVLGLFNPGYNFIWVLLGAFFKYRKYASIGHYC